MKFEIQIEQIAVQGVPTQIEVMEFQSALQTELSRCLSSLSASALQRISSQRVIQIDAAAVSGALGSRDLGQSLARAVSSGLTGK